MDDIYGNGNPPYSLYQGVDGRWGLVDRDGNKLKAVFKKLDNGNYSCIQWEAVSFNPDEGFELDAWCDPCEVWFNFTFDDPRYPGEYAKYLWEPKPKHLEEYASELRSLLPEDLHWLFDCSQEAVRILDIDDEAEYHSAISGYLETHPFLKNVADYNSAFDVVMCDDNISEDIKSALWNAKVALDGNIRFFIEENDDPDRDIRETERMCDYVRFRQEMKSNRTREIIRTFALIQYAKARERHRDIIQNYSNSLLKLIAEVHAMPGNRDMAYKAIREVWVNEMELDMHPMSIVHKFIARFNDEGIKCPENECLAISQSFIDKMDYIMREISYGDEESTTQFINNISKHA